MTPEPSESELPTTWSASRAESANLRFRITPSAVMRVLPINTTMPVPIRVNRARISRRLLLSHTAYNTVRAMQATSQQQVPGSWCANHVEKDRIVRQEPSERSARPIRTLQQASPPPPPQTLVCAIRDTF